MSWPYVKRAAEVPSLSVLKYGILSFHPGDNWVILSADSFRLFAEIADGFF